MGLREYRKKRDFSRTPEPEGNVQKPSPDLLYVIHKHAASHLHYDLRLEMEGVLKSWAVPKGPSLDCEEKRLAVHVEDHPVEYGGFEGVIPEGEYGGGTVMLWDQGVWVPEGDAEAKYRKGHLMFELRGKKLHGTWTLARMGGRSGEEGKNWLLMKKRDSGCQPVYDILQEQPLSAATGRSMGEIAASEDRVWSGERGEIDPPAKTSVENGMGAGAMPGARPGPMPVGMKPQLATLVKEPPTGERWLHEIKYDGYRILCFKNGRSVRLMSRNDNDWTARFPAVARAASSLLPREMIMDGEIVVLRPDGTTDFQALQNALEGVQSWGRIGYYVFDLIYYEGYDLTGAPLIERKRLLKAVLEKPPISSSLIYGDHICGKGRTIYEHACRLGTEGIVSKREDSGYEERRSGSWLKVKCIKRQEFVIGGYSEPSGSRTAFGALLLGYYEGTGELTYAGRVGTGFNEDSLKRIMTALKSIEQKESPFHNPPSGRDARGVHWVNPALVAEAEFTEWTQEGILRHPSFKGLREDKDPREVTREPAEPSTQAIPAKSKSSSRVPAARHWSSGNRTDTVAGVPITNPERILYPEQGLTKLALTAYYEKVAGRMLPHIKGRPLTLVRCPQGMQRKCFYQKHLTEQTPAEVKEIPVREKEGVQMYVAVNDLAGLISLVQLGVLEIHPWGSRGDRLEQPDRLIFDLDPGEGVSTEQLVDAARLMHHFLEELGIRSFLKTTGGKGYHVVAPLVRGPGWGELKEFAEKAAQETVRMRPDLLISTMRKSRRKGKIFVDYLRNARGATAVAPYSTRARHSAPVAVPLSWEELSPGLSPDEYKLENISSRLTQTDPWAEFFRIRQSLTRGMKRRVRI